jgi:hypothetical protein
MKNRPSRLYRRAIPKAIPARTEADRPFAENLYRHLRFEHDSVVTNAPEASGVYGLFNALWVYIGEADNIREGLLGLLDGDLACLTRYQPSGFAFELVSPAERRLRHEYLIERYQPFCQCSRRNRKAFFMEINKCRTSS